MFDQIAITIIGCITGWLVNDADPNKRKYASIFGLASQPFWFYSAYITEQWGIFFMSIMYTALWMRGFYNSWLLPTNN